MRTVIVDGTPVHNVPDNVTDEEVLKKELSQREAEQSGTTEDFLMSTAIGFSDVGGNILEAGADVGELIAGENPVTDYLNSLSDRQEESADFFREGTKDSPYASGIGEAAPLLAAFGTAGAVGYTALTGVGVSGATAGVASGIAVDQIYADADENLFNILGTEFAPLADNAFTTALMADENDTILQKRGKLLVEGALLGGAFEGIARIPDFAKFAKNTTGKALSELDVKKKSEALWEYLKTKVPRGDDLADLGPKVVKDEATGSYRMITPEEQAYSAGQLPAQIKNQNSSFLSKVKQQIFTSRGYLEPEAYNAFEGSKAAKRQLETKAEHISLRIHNIMDSLPEEEVSKNYANINKAMNEGLEFLDRIGNNVYGAKELNTYGGSSSWLYSDGKVVDSHGDHLAAAYKGASDYLENSKATGSVRSSFYIKDEYNPASVFITLQKGQKLSNGQHSTIKQFVKDNDAEFYVSVADDIGDKSSAYVKTDISDTSMVGESSPEFSTKTSKEWIKAARQEEFAYYHGLDEGIAEEILESKELIDDLSRTILGTNVVNPETKEIIAGNIGKYTTRSYRLFEDKNYAPTDKVRRNAERYFADRYFQGKKGQATYTEAEAVGRTAVMEILGESTGEERAFFSATNSINKGIFKGKKDIDAPVRELLGEITDPTERVMMTVSKMANVTENYKFLDTMKRLGNGKYIFKADQRPDVKMFNSQITGTNSSLDGMYTTPEVLEAIKNKEGRLFNLGNDPKAGMMANATVSGYRKFLAAKAFSQKSKTIYSHVTQLRNYLGGLQFGIANGMKPWSDQNVSGLLKNEVFQKGDKAMNELYEKYQGLGIINTTVRVNEFRELMDTAFDSADDQLLTKIDGIASKYGAIKETDRVLEQTYMATDDFFKIHGFNNELDVLKRANPGVPIEALEAEAADIIQNTFPNYDRVPKGIKALKELPVGNFFSFPAEITRTSVNIIKRGAKELRSDNPVIQQRGRERLLGYFESTAAWGSVGYASANLMGMSPEEKQAADTVTEAPWSKESERIYFRDSENGSIWYNDTQFLNSYSTVTEPFIAIAQEIYNGEKSGKELDEYMVKAISKGMEKVISPYLSGSIMTTAITDLGFAAIAEDGRTPDGKGIFQPGKERTDQYLDAMYHVMASVTPGSLISLGNLSDAAIGKLKRTDDSAKKDLASELITNLTGLKFSKLDPEYVMRNEITRYAVGTQNLINYQPDYEAKGEDIVQKYIGNHKEDYRRQAELYKKSEAVSTLIGSRGPSYLLLEEQLGEDKADNIISGLFMPKEPSDEMLVNLFGKTFSDMRHDYDEVEGTEGKTVESLFRAYAEMLATDLTTLDTKDEEGNVDEEDKRILKSTGGLVSTPVPQAPIDPSERINKVTGRPYSEDAGSLSDPLQRLGFHKGGWVTREQYALGGIVKKLAPKARKFFDIDSPDEKALLKASESLAGSPLTDEDLLMPMRVSYMNSNKSTPKARLEKLGDRDAGNYDDILPIDSPEAQKIIEEQGIELAEGQSHIVVQNIVKQSKGESPVDTKYAAVSREDIDAMYFDNNRSLYTAKSRIDEEEFSNLWRSIDDADVYGNVIPQGRAAIEALSEKSNIRADTLQTMMDFIIPEQYAQEFKDIIETEELSTEAIKRLEDAFPPIPARRMMAMNNNKDPVEFLKDSKVKKAVFRGTTSDEPNRDLMISTVMPREIGTHVGATPEQANSIVIKHIGEDGPDGPITSMKSIENEMSRRGLEEGTQITKYLVSIKNPLRIDDDVSDWDARAIIAKITSDSEVTDRKPLGDILEELDGNPTFWETVNASADLEDEVMEYVDLNLNGTADEELSEYLYESGVDLDELDSYIDSVAFSGKENSFAKAIEKQTGKAVDMDRLASIYDGTLETALGGADDHNNVLSFLEETIERYEVNREFREYLKELGFDGIDYKNMGEPTKKGGSNRSYILFDPEQIKLTTGGKDPKDPRVQKASGGIVRSRLESKYASTPIHGSGIAPPITVDPQAVPLIQGGIGLKDKLHRKFG